MKPNYTKSKAGPQVEPSVEAGEKVERDWRPIETIPTHGRKVFLRHADGAETHAYANPEFKHNALRYFTEWSPTAPSEKPERGELAEAVAKLIDGIEVVTGAHGPRIRTGEKARVTNAILAALATQEQEPVAWQRDGTSGATAGWVPVDEEDIPHYRGKGQEVRALYAHPVQESRGEDLLAAFGKQTQLELSYQHGDEDGDRCGWTVHAVHGGRNDREWTELAQEATPAEAIRKALAALQDTPQASSEAGQ